MKITFLKNKFFRGMFRCHMSYVASVKFHNYKLILILIVSSIKLLQMSLVASVKCQRNCKIYKKIKNYFFNLNLHSVHKKN